MYAWIWKHLPGPVPVRIAIVIAALVGLFFLLMDVIYPAVESALPFSGVSVSP